MERFLVAAVASVLAIRVFLRLTGYPQIGGSGLHIAHMLWGGILMLASIIILLSFLNSAAHWWAAVTGGVGFGTFIDEVGKFVTSDHNYFFQPAVSMIYVTFILIFLAVRSIHRGQTYSREEYLGNALKQAEEVVLHDLDEEERLRVMAYLELSDPHNPLVAAIKFALTVAPLRPPAPPSLFGRAKRLLQRFYYYVAGFWWFPFLVIAFFIGQLIIKLIYVFIIIFFIGLGWEQILSVRVIGRIAERMVNLSFVDWAEIVSWLLSGMCVFCGVALMRRSRVSALEWFKRSIFVSILLTQVFAFYKEQFSALLGLFFNIAILAVLHFVIKRERAARPLTITAPPIES